MAVRQPDPTPGLEPERGLVLAVLAQGVDPDDELAELEELARTAGVEPVGAGRPASAASRPADVHRQGEARRAEDRLQGGGRGSPARRRRALPVAAAGAREPAPGARRRPRRADPRHLRAARGERRGQAPGRARAARVQPSAHARHVAAPRAPRRRRRHERPRRVAARDRPPDRTPPRLAPEEPAQGSPEAARRPPQGAPPDARRRPSRSPATRTSASRRS